MQTPVALIIFKRPETTKRVFEVIRQVKPPKLLLIADGPRKDKPDEAEKCSATRAIIEKVDWDCEVLKNYSNINLGCGKCPAMGITWVFEQVEEAIILEDDCVPHPTFFRFCEELLKRYRDDERIMIISGNNFQFGRQRTEHSYYFSRYTHSWGWATWRRAWEYYDFEMKLWPKIRDSELLKYILEEPSALKYWTRIFQQIYEKKITSAWDYQWTFACWLQNGLTILPNVNLVSNIGFGTESTHTVDSKNPFANLPVQEMYLPLNHPPFVIRDNEADKFTQNTMFAIPLTKRLYLKLKKYLTN
jgi:hypothetical protein